MASKVGFFSSTRGEEAPCQHWLASEFRARGFDIDAFSIDDVDIAGLPGYSPRDNADYAESMQVVATHWPMTESGRSLILQGHIDVVPPGPRYQWTHDPFDPQFDGIRVKGRGVNEMKCGVAQMVFALDAIRASGFEPAGRIHLETVTEKECTGNGALATLVRGPPMPA